MTPFLRLVRQITVIALPHRLLNAFKVCAPVSEMKQPFDVDHSSLVICEFGDGIISENVQVIELFLQWKHYFLVC